MCISILYISILCIFMHIYIYIIVISILCISIYISILYIFMRLSLFISYLYFLERSTFLRKVDLSFLGRSTFLRKVVQQKCHPRSMGHQEAQNGRPCLERSTANWLPHVLRLPTFLANIDARQISLQEPWPPGGTKRLTLLKKGRPC